MKKLYMTLLLLACLVLASPAGAASISIGAAAGYNAFILGNFEGYNNDVEGRLAVGGDASLTNYSVGSALSGDTAGNSLVVGGNLSADNLGVANGDVVLGGTATGFSTPASGTLYQTATVPVDFEAAGTALRNLSTSLAGETANGQVTASGNLLLTGDGTDALQVFDVTAAELLSAYALSLSQIAETATILINVSGAIAGTSYLGMTDFAAYRGNVLLNFYEATELKLMGSVDGSILAPNAAVTAMNGALYGTLIANSFTGSSELENYLFDSAEEPPTTVPEPGTLLTLGLGLLGLAAFRRFRG